MIKICLLPRNIGKVTVILQPTWVKPFLKVGHWGTLCASAPFLRSAGSSDRDTKTLTGIRLQSLLQ